MSDPIADAVDDVLGGFAPAEQADPQVAMMAWAALSELGFPLVGVDEDLGGSGGAESDALTLLRAIGRHGSSVPIADSGFLASYALATGGLEVDDRMLAVASPLSALRIENGRVYGTALDVAWADRAAALVAIVEGPESPTVVELDLAACRLGTARATTAGEPRVRVDVEGVAPLRAAPTALTSARLLRRAAASRVALIAGALAGARDMTVRYTAERVQFGKPVASFQAVQVHLARVAEDAELVGIATDTLGVALDGMPDPAFEIASATLLARECARESSRAAHQAHGAMGATREYPLHVLTRHLWQWAHEYGDRDLWRNVVLDAIRDVGVGNHYGLVVAGSFLRGPATARGGVRDGRSDQGRS